MIEIPRATITVANPGAGPQRLIELRPDRPSELRLFTNSLEVSMVAGGSPSGGNRDVTLPMVAQPTCADPLEVYLFLAAPVSTDAGLTEALAGHDGQVVQVRLTPGGEVASFSISAPPGIDNEAQATFEQALLQTFLRLIPLPDVAVGAGAQWTVTRQIVADSDLTQTMTVTLSEDANLPTLTAVVDESPDGSLFRVPGSNATLTIDSYTMAGTGTAVIDPTLAFPVGGGVQLDGGRTLVGDDPGRTLTQRTGNVYRWDAAQP